MSNMMKKSVESGMAFAVFCIVFGSVGMAVYLSVNASSWPTESATLWNLIPVVSILSFMAGLIYAVISVTKKG